MPEGSNPACPKGSNTRAFSSCNNDEDFAPQTDDLKDTPITVTAGVDGMLTRAGYETNSEDNMKSVLPETFYLSVTQSKDETSQYNYTNVPMKFDNGAWTAYESDGSTEKQLLWEGAPNITVTAATFSLKEAQTLEVQTDQSMEDKLKVSDHLYMAETNMEANPGGINVKFSHLMSKIELTITLGNEFESETNPISGVTFTGTVASNSYTAGTGWTDIAGDATTADITAFEGTYDKEKISATYEVILVPQTVKAGTFAVSFRVRNRDFKWTSTDAVTFAGGTKYALTLNAGKDKVSDASFTAGAWSGNSNSSVATE